MSNIILTKSKYFFSDWLSKKINTTLKSP